MGLPWNVWVVRKLIPTKPLFTAFNGMPITREFRFFTKDGKCDGWQPYWPMAAIADDPRPKPDGWETILAAASLMTLEEESTLTALAERAGTALDGYWSVDFLQDMDGKWYLTDCAEGDKSFRYDPANPPKPMEPEPLDTSLIYTPPKKD